MLRIENLTKRYDDHLVFEGLNHSFEPGCVALCEEESTGKTSLLAIIAGAMAPSSGDVWIDGHSLKKAPREAKLRLAYIPDDCLQFPDMTGRALLERVAAEKNVAIDDNVIELASRFELTEHLDKRFEQMSTGMRRKVYLTAAALGNPAVVIADGPSSGLDSASCAVLADVFKTWGRDCVVLFASHDAKLVQECGATPLNISAPD
ncbi:ATP-binding cassette domain-containing protein [Pusillimonas sp. NJUB218]|uniref:ABC transporter ATP-binding protein n=1 Tax=Pusillimonas sp. NJUB218 TaxID=2023230 RepID=UPI000F4D26F2|nr:ATP-binding cassette domain-containing protein [Pusillimonas sp. NJUB218]ROT46333.1 ABC transporter ATP-binding protein [Pusillimonas sp. NJUB218]